MDDRDNHSGNMLIKNKIKEENKMNNQNDSMNMHNLLRIKQPESSRMFLRKRWKQKKRWTTAE